MIACPVPYRKMKDSGVEWLGKVPAHWRVWRLKASVHGCINGIWGNDPNGREDLPCIRVADFDRVRLRVKLARPTLRAIAPNERNRRLLKKSDLLLEKSGGGDLQPVGVVMLYDHDVEAVCSNFVARMPVSDRFDPNYLTYLHSHLYAIRLNVRSIKQTTGIQNLDSSSYLGESVAFPPFPEQAAIVRYLDHVDRRIQRYIRAKLRLIALLEEQKKAVIHQAVTGQSDVRTGRPYPAYKDSGVEWLEEVPEHWVVAALRFRYQQCLGKMLDTKHITGEYLVPYLRNVDVQWDDINVLNLPMIDIRPCEVDRYTVRTGDLLVCEGGEVGRCAIWEEETGVYGYQKALHRLRPHLRNRDRPRFMYYTLRLAVTRDAFNDGHESTIGHLTGDKLRTHRFPFPPCPEQLCIEKFLDNQTESIDSAMAAERRVIDLLREYRTRLIADVVTGKLDVREAAARLPDQIEEPHPRDEDEAWSEPVSNGIAQAEALH